MTDPTVFFPTAEAGVAAEADLLALARPARLIWAARAPAIVWPWRFARAKGYPEAAAEAARAGWPVVLRPSGGGAVPQGPGVMNLAMVWPAGPDMAIEDAYRALCAPIQQACAAFGLDARPGATEASFCDGAFNLSVGGRKIVGTAQRWRSIGGRRIVLAHAMILMDPPAPGAIAAIDRLQRGVGLDLALRADVHAGLGAVAPGLTPPAFARALDQAAQAALAALAG